MIARSLWWLMFGLYGRIVPFAAARYIAYPVAWIASILRIRRAVVDRNLGLAFRDVAGSDRRRLARRALRNVATVLLEIPILPYLSQARLGRVMTFENLDLVSGPSATGLILLSAHIGNWELLALGAGAQSGRPSTIVVKDQRDHGLLNRIRTSRGNRVVSTSHALRELMSVLSAGGTAALLADQSAAPPDPVVPFFDIPTHFFSTPARMALRYRSRVVLGFAVRQPNGTYRAGLTELRHDDLDDTPDGRLTFTQRYAAALHATILAHPEQWMWTHRKWKQSPGISYDN